MNIHPINNKNQWEDFLRMIEEKTFLHSWNWGELQEALGEKIWRLGVFSENGLSAAALVIKIEARRGTFLFCPHGPVTNLCGRQKRHKILKALMDYLQKLSKEEKVSFIRISPIWKRNKENEQVFQGLGFRQAPIHVHPENNWVLDLNKPEEELLREMRKSTRYLIKKGLKNPELRIIKSQNIRDIEAFNRIYQATAERQKFVPFSLEYLKKEFFSFSRDNEALIFLAENQEEIIGSAIIIFWQNMAFYHQGASLQKYPDIPANHLLQWEAIKEAQKRGCKIYSFWGIAPEDKPEHPWKGITIFKKGFGGRKIKYIKTQDYPLSLGYWKNYLIERQRAKKRGFK
jgi:peptidoglycan pentaglycine glycine transferase (the first glycine)